MYDETACVANFGGRLASVFLVKQTDLDQHQPVGGAAPDVSVTLKCALRMSLSGHHSTVIKPIIRPIAAQRWRWGTVNAETKVPLCRESRAMKRPPFEPGVAQNVFLHACPTARK